MTRERLKIIQIVLEAAIPLLGFFFWNWNLYFILLFYLLDLISDHLFKQLAGRKIVKEGTDSASNGVKYGAIGILLLLIIVVLVNLGMYVIHPEIDLFKEVIAFWNYEDMGLKQGYFLLPLVLMGSYQQYKMEFLMPARYKTYNHKQNWFPVYMAYFICIAGAGLVIALSGFIKFREIIYVLSIIAGTSLYAFFKK